MRFEELDEYKKDLKALIKKFRSLEEDLDLVKRILSIKPIGSTPFSHRINNLGIETCVIKVKKIACKSLKGKGVNSGFRLVYAYFKTIPKVEETGDTTIVNNGSSNNPSVDNTQKIVLVELYHKSQQSKEDRARIKRHFN